MIRDLLQAMDAVPAGQSRASEHMTGDGVRITVWGYPEQIRVIVDLGQIQGVHVEHGLGVYHVLPDLELAPMVHVNIGYEYCDEKQQRRLRRAAKEGKWS